MKVKSIIRKNVIMRQNRRIFLRFFATLRMTEASRVTAAPQTTSGLTWLLLLFISSSLCPLQSVNAQEHTLDDILKLAARQTNDRRIIEQTYKAGLADINILRSSLLPQLTTELSATRSSRSLTGFNQSQPSSTQNTQTGSPRNFNTDERIYGNDYRWNLRLSQPLFSFGRLTVTGLLVRDRREFLKAQKDLQLESYLLEVIQSYNHTLLKLNTWEAAKRSEKYAKLLLDFTQIEYEGGGRSKIDLLRSKSFYSMASAQTQKAESEYLAAHARLKTILNLESNEALVLRSGSDLKTRFLDVSSISSSTRKDLKTKELEVDIKDNMVWYRRGAYFPLLSLFGGVDSQAQEYDFYAQNDEFNDVFDEERFSYSVGLSLTWTLFDGLKSYNETSKAISERVVAKMQLEKLRREEKIAEQETQEQLRVAELMYDASQTSRDATKLAFEQIESDYKAGTASLTDVLELQKELWEAEKQLNEAFANKILAAARFRVAKGAPLHKGVY